MVVRLYGFAISVCVDHCSAEHFLDEYQTLCYNQLEWNAYTTSVLWYWYPTFYIINENCGTNTWFGESHMIFKQARYFPQRLFHGILTRINGKCCAVFTYKSHVNDIGSINSFIQAYLIRTNRRRSYSNVMNPTNVPFRSDIWLI